MNNGILLLLYSLINIDPNVFEFDTNRDQYCASGYQVNIHDHNILFFFSLINILMCMYMRNCTVIRECFLCIRCLQLVCEHVCVRDRFQSEITQTWSYMVVVDILDYILTLYKWIYALYSTYFIYGFIVDICTAVCVKWWWYDVWAVKWAQFDSSG